jgi:hypothetical protein
MGKSLHCLSIDRGTKETERKQAIIKLTTMAARKMAIELTQFRRYCHRVGLYVIEAPDLSIAAGLQDFKA